MTPILVSACLLGRPVRYDGSDKLADSAILQRWLAEGRVVSVCPELAGDGVTAALLRAAASRCSARRSSRRPTRCWPSSMRDRRPSAEPGGAGSCPIERIVCKRIQIGR